jgi:hypothetical protein
VSLHGRLGLVTALLRAALAGLVIAGAALGYRLATERTDRPPLLGILASTVLVALVLGWTRGWIEHVAGRIVLGPRADSYAVLEDLLAKMASSLPVDEVVVRLAEAAGRDRQRAEVRVWLADGSAWGETWPAQAPDAVEAYRVDVQHHGASVGEISVGADAEPLSAYDRRLLDELAAPAGVALSTVRLTVDLRRREAELKGVNRALAASSDRMRGARLRERHRMRSEVNHKVVPHIRAGKALLVEDAVDAAAVRREATVALDELRMIARGIHPARLLEDGVLASLDSWTGRTNHTVVIAGGPPDELDEALLRCVYFCAVILLDALAVAGSSALSLALETEGEELALNLAGRLGQADSIDSLAVQLVRDRAEAFDGLLQVVREADRMTFRCRWPLRSPVAAS